MLRRPVNRRARKRKVRVATINMERQSQNETERLRGLEPDDGARRLPLTRAECEKGERPCPYISCRYHLFLGVDPSNGSIKLNFPDLLDDSGAPELDDLPATCALDVADRDGVTLETLGELMNITRERARQLETIALDRFRLHLATSGIKEAHDVRNVIGVFDNPYADDVD